MSLSNVCTLNACVSVLNINWLQNVWRMNKKIYIRGKFVLVCLTELGKEGGSNALVQLVFVINVLYCL